MVVLVAVLAPVFTRYIESSRRSTDVQNANSIAEAVLSDVADGIIKVPADSDTVQEEVKDKTGAGETGTNVSAIAKAPETKGDVYGEPGLSFTYVYHKSTNTCDVFVTGHTDGYNLAIEGDKDQGTGAQGYKNAD